MNGQDPRTLRGRVFVSYAHDAEGRRLATALCAALRARGCDVVSDRDIPRLNPSSLPAWMDEQIEQRVVLCVLSNGYLRAFAEVADGEPARRGVRYELRAIRQKIYDHEGRTGCPVIPVASPSFEAESAPNTIRALDIGRFDPNAQFGTSQLIERIVALEGTGDDDAMKTQEPTGQVGVKRTFRQVMYDLQAADPLDKDALQLVREGLELVVRSDLAPELLEAFPLMARPIKVHGQVVLMQTLTTECLKVLRSTPQLLRWERACEPRVLICGRGWSLQREHYLPEALAETQRGVQLAEKYQDLHAAAHGKKCIGDIRRLLAEDARGQDREYHLRTGTESLEAAVSLYSAIERNGARRSEVGSCLCLTARIQLTWYRLLKDKHALRCAAEFAQRADELLTSCQETDRYELATLRAEIAAAKHRYVEARAQLGTVIESLISKPDAIYQEILANAYVARAHVTLASRGAKDGARRDLRNARDIYNDRNYEYAVASCEWTMLMVDSKSVTPLKITREDVLQLEEITPDPRTRLRAVAELTRQFETRIGNRPSGRKVSWDNIVSKVAHSVRRGQ